LKNKLNFGIIGCSRIAKNSVIPAIMKSDYAELKFIGSRSEEKAKKFSMKFTCTQFGSYDEVLENNEIDAVYISVPVGLHEKWTIKSTKSGKHVLCEKSLTTSYSSAKSMVKYSRQNKVRLMEGLMFRFHPSHKKVRELIKSGFLGKPFSFYGQYGFPSISHEDIRYRKDLGGGVFNDAACYPICASRMVFSKEPIGVLCNFSIDKESGVDTKTSLLLKYSEMEFAHMDIGYDLFYQNMYHIWGSEGYLRLLHAYNIPPNMEAKITINSNKKTEELTIVPNDHFKIMIDSFCQEILGISSCNFNFEDDLLKQALIMDAARKSNNGHNFVEIDIKNTEYYE